MLINWENEGYINACLQPDIIPVEDKCSYIPTSIWGYIKGDISEQSDLMELLTNVESGLTADQIALLVNADSRFTDIEKDINEISSEITLKANTADVYTKSEIDSKGYLTEHQDLTGYATESWVSQQGYLTEHQSLAGYATEEWVSQQGYLTEHQSLAGYATENWVYEKGYLSTETDPIWSAEKHKYALKTELPSISGLASTTWVNEQLTSKANTADVYTKSEIDSKGYLTEHQSLDNYYTKTEVDTAIENVEVDLTGYATEEWVSQQGYITSIPSEYITEEELNTAIEGVDVDLTGYATESYVDTAVENKVDISDIWNGTQEDWDALTGEQRSSYIIAMIEI